MEKDPLKQFGQRLVEIRKQKPDYVIIFPWNIKEEVVKQLEYIRSWDAKFVVAIPHLTTI